MTFEFLCLQKLIKPKSSTVAPPNNGFSYDGARIEYASSNTEKRELF